ncbi:MAG: transketolase-like TK C-terminal-containing protein, partial [Sphingorhabdus sp.]
QGTSATHGSPLGADEVAATRAELGWDAVAFEVPAAILNAWREAGRRATSAHSEWKNRLSKDPNGADFMRRMNGDWPPVTGMEDYLASLIANPSNVATRKASEMALEALTAAVPELVGGSADLTGSNNTKTKSTLPMTKTDYAGRYVYYGIREFGMAAAMNGMALHGGIIPYGGTFLVFSDYCRNAIRLSAIQRQRVIYVMTHDSIGLGEDGPTHQPVEHLISLRAMPNLTVFRPCDAVETAECWSLALANKNGPSLLALSRQNLPQLRHDVKENLCTRGAYRIREARATRKVVIIGTGSEVELAIKVADVLEADGVGADVVSMPSWEYFDAQDAAYRADILPQDVMIVSIEAGVTLGWERYTGSGGLNIGIDTFGASAPAETLFDHFGFSVEMIVQKINAKIAD